MRKILAASASCLILAGAALGTAHAQTTQTSPASPVTPTPAPPAQPVNPPALRSTTTTPATPPTTPQSIGEKTGVNSVIGTSPTTQDFVTEVATSDMFEIQSSQLAQEKADAPTKTFAAQMVTDHQKTTSELSGLVQAGTVKATLPTQFDSSHQKSLDRLKGLSGAAFTRQYHRDQVSAHRTAVSLFQRYAKGGDNSALKTWAGQTLPTLQTHLRMAQTLNK